MTAFGSRSFRLAQTRRAEVRAFRQFPSSAPTLPACVTKRAGPNSATSDFFICIGDQPALDFGGHRNLDGQGFAAFGRVTDGRAVVRAIQSSSANGQQLDPPIPITRIRRVAK